MNYFDSFREKRGIDPREGIHIKEAHLPNVMLTWVELEAGSVIPEHRHPHEQISMVVDGKMEMTVGGRVRMMEKGDFAIVPSDTPHSVRVIDRSVAVDAWNPIRADYIAGA